MKQDADGECVCQRSNGRGDRKVGNSNEGIFLGLQRNGKMYNETECRF